MKTTSKFIIFLFMFFSFSKMHCADYEKFADQITNSFINDIEKKYKIYCCGSGGTMPYNIEEFIIGFVAYRSTSLEEARKLEISLVTELTNRINKNEEIRSYLREYPFPKKKSGNFYIL